MARITAPDPDGLKALCSELREVLDSQVQSGAEYTHQPTRPGTSYTSRRVTGNTHGGTPQDKTDKPLDLGSTTFNRLQGDGDAAQKRGIGEWKEWAKRHRHIKPESWSPTDMVKLADIMSQIYFLDELRSKFHFKWEHGLALEVDGVRGAYGDATHLPDSGVQIRMDPGDHSDIKQLDDHFTAIISTFTHELSHCYFFSLCCDGGYGHNADGSCYTNGQAVWPPDEGDGHDMGWFFVACKIDLCMEQLIGVKGHLFSFRSLIRHCKKGGMMTAGDWMLFFSMFTWEEVSKLYGHLHESHEKRSEKRDLEKLIWEDTAVMEVWAQQGEQN